MPEGSGADLDERLGSDVAAVAPDDGTGPASTGSDDTGDGSRGWQIVQTEDQVGHADGSGTGTATELAAEQAREAAEDEGEASDRTTQRILVPDFTGLTVAGVLRAAHRSGVELALNESSPITGVALRQEPPPGPAERGVICRVVFGRAQ